MATLTLTIAAATDDFAITDASDVKNPTIVGAVGTTPLAGHGMGFRFLNVTLTSVDTVTSVKLSLMKSGTHFANMACRWTAIDADNVATFGASSPNRPGDHPIVSASIADEALNRNETDGTRYEFPSTSPHRATLAAAVQAVIDRAGWASGNALAIVCNSDQDASAYQSFARKAFHDHDSATADSEPQLIIDYTPGGSASRPSLHQSRMRRVG